MVRTSSIFLLLAMLSPLCLAARSLEQEMAAVVDGQLHLRDEILQTQIDTTWTVDAVLRPCGGPEALNPVLTRLEVPGGPRWLDDRVCQVRVQVQGKAVADAIIAAVEGSQNRPVELGWLRNKLANWSLRTFAAAGSNATVAPAIPAATTATSVMTSVSTAPAVSIAGVMLPEQPPQWVFGLADSESLAHSAEGRLKTARLAEAQALATLTDHVRQLEIYPQVTLGTLCDKNPAVRRGVDAAMTQARVYKCEYRADGSVMVRMSLNLRILWAELDAARQAGN